jgi:hypothetical protein
VGVTGLDVLFHFAIASQANHGKIVIHHVFKLDFLDHSFFSGKCAQRYGLDVSALVLGAVVPIVILSKISLKVGPRDSMRPIEVDVSF